MIAAQPRRRARLIRRFPGRIGTATPNPLLDTWEKLTPSQMDRNGLLRQGRTSFLEVRLGA